MAATFADRQKQPKPPTEKAWTNLATAFGDIVVLEWDDRLSIRGCGSLLAQAGASVFSPSASPNAPLDRGKAAILDSPEAKIATFAKANVIVTSSDRTSAPPLPARRPDQIVCDITVSRRGEARFARWNEPLLQAAAGLADITGTPASGPTICDAPIVELQAAIYAASGVLAAWRRRSLTGEGSLVRLSLLDCAISGLSSVLPLVFAGQSPQRLGNRHALAAPWNAYRCADGWILLCSATDEQWRRLCDLIGQPTLADGAFARLPDRVALCAQVDKVVEDWTSMRTMEACLSAFAVAGLSAGQIASLESLATEPNLRHRNMVSDGVHSFPRSFLRTSSQSSAADDRGQLAQEERLPPGTDLPLLGVKVVEIGQYTTAPLAARQLAMLGAQVLKIEPPGGEATRSWAPHQDGESYFFTLTNANKANCELDLRNTSGRSTLSDLLAEADVLIENLKPGSLHRLGFGPDQLAALNARLIYCPISGFGVDSAYPGRPAFDTVVQAMSGLMALTRAEDRPTKLGISASDLVGGAAGLFCVLAGLEQRYRTGRGGVIDLSMQDASVWITQTLWNGGAAADFVRVRCADGFVIAGCSPSAMGGLADGGERLSRDEFLNICREADIPAAPVRTIKELATDPAIVGPGPVILCKDELGREWPLFRSLIRFEGLAERRPVLMQASAGACFAASAAASARKRGT